MKKKLLNFKSFINEDLASKYKYDEKKEIQDEKKYVQDNDNIEQQILNIQSKLEKYEPNFIYSDYIIDSQIENAGIIKYSVWIEYLDVADPKQYDYDELEEDFLSETDFDEVKILTTENSITYSINIYDYDE